MVTVLALLGVIAVLFAAAVVATSDRPVLADAAPDAADLPLPDEPLTPDDVSRLRFSMSARGYRMSEVDEALARLADELADRDRRIALLEAAAQASAPAVAAAPEVEEPVVVREATMADLPVVPAAGPPSVVPPPTAGPPQVVPPAAPVAQPAPATTSEPVSTGPDDADVTDPLPPADLAAELLTEELLEQAQQTEHPSPPGATHDEGRPPHPS